MKHLRSSLLLLFSLTSPCNLLGMEMVSSAATFNDLIKEKAQIWAQSKSKYSAFYAAVIEGLKKFPQENPTVIAEAAAKKVGLNWPLDDVHYEGLAEHGSSWNSTKFYAGVKLTQPSIIVDYAPVRGHYGIRNANAQERKAYLNQTKDSNNTLSEYSALGVRVDLFGNSTPELSFPYSANSIFPIQISPNGKYVLALSPDEKSVTLYLEAANKVPARALYSFAAELCKKHFYLTDTHLYCMEQSKLYKYNLSALTLNIDQVCSLVNSFGTTIGSTAVTPALVASPNDTYKLIRGIGKKLHIIGVESHTSRWPTMSTVELPQSVERYDIRLLEKMGIFVAIHTSGYSGDLENKHIIGSLKKPHKLQNFSEQSAGKCAVSPCQRYLALTNYFTENITLFAIDTKFLQLEDGLSCNPVEKLGMLPADQVLGWSDSYGAPLLVSKKNKHYAFYSSPVTALLASHKTESRS